MTLKRGAAPKRKTGLKRSRPKSANPARKKKEFLRCFGSAERVEWVRGLPSVVSGERPCENVHVRSGGAGRRADACWIVPLTRKEHRELHSVGKKEFEERCGINLDYHATLTELVWQESRRTVPPIEQRRASESVLPLPEGAPLQRDREYTGSDT